MNHSSRTEPKLPEMTISQEHFSKVSMRKCDVRLDLVSFLKVTIIFRHATLNFARTLSLPPFWVLVPIVIWKIKKITSSPLWTLEVSKKFRESLGIH